MQDTKDFLFPIVCMAKKIALLPLRGILPTLHHDGCWWRWLVLLVLSLLLLCDDSREKAARSAVVQ